MSKNILTLSGGISPWEISARFVRQELAKLTGDIEIHISSFGGSFYEGMEIFNLIRNYSASKGKVTTVNISKVMSAGSHIFLAGDIRKAYANSTFMAHNAWTVAWGDANDMRRETRVLDGIDDIQASIYAKFQKRSKKEIRADMSNELWYIGEDQLMQSGFIDEIIEDFATESEAKSTQSEVQTSYNEFVAEYKIEFEKHEINIDFNKVEKNIKVCKGKCTLVENPSSEKQANNEEITVGKKTVEELQAELDTANKSIEANKVEMDKLQTEINTLRDSNEKLTSEVSASQDGLSVDFVKEIVALGGVYNASPETLVEMIESKDTVKAENIVLKTALKSDTDGATVEAGHQEGDAEQKPKANYTKEELQEMLDGK